MKDALEMRERHTDGCDIGHFHRGDGEDLRILRCRFVSLKSSRNFEKSFFLHLQGQTVQGEQFGLLGHEAKGILIIHIFGGLPTQQHNTSQDFNF